MYKTCTLKIMKATHSQEAEVLILRYCYGLNCFPIIHKLKYKSAKRLIEECS